MTLTVTDNQYGRLSYRHLGFLSSLCLFVIMYTCRFLSLHE